MILWKYHQYFSKFGKLSSGHKTGKIQFSFQSQKKTMPKNVQTTARLHLSHMLTKKCSKLCKLDFNSIWTVNFQMFKLNLEKVEEPEIKLPTSVRSYKNKEISRKTPIYTLLTMPKPWLCGSQQTLENSEMEPDLPFEKSVCRSGSNS